MKKLIFILLLSSSVAMAQKKGPMYIWDAKEIGKSGGGSISGVLIKKKIEAKQMFLYIVNYNTTYKVKCVQRSLYDLVKDDRRVYVFTNLSISNERN